jgi:hypothetical protein
MMTQYLDPRKEPHRWLRGMLEHMVNLAYEGDKEAAQICKSEFQSLILMVETGFIQNRYEPWIDDYVDVLEKYKNNPNMSDLLLNRNDSQVTEE